MARAINVKVARIKVIEALTNKLQEMKEAKEAYDLADKQHEANRKMWEAEVSRIALTHFDTAKADDKVVSIRTWGYNSEKETRVEFEIKLNKSLLPDEPEKPKDPFQSYGYGRQHVGNYDERVEEIQNAIRILKLSDEEVVSTSTYQSVSRFL